MVDKMYREASKVGSITNISPLNDSLEAHRCTKILKRRYCCFKTTTITSELLMRYQIVGIANCNNSELIQYANDESIDMTFANKNKTKHLRVQHH